MITILHPPNADGVRLEGMADESTLVKTEGIDDNENETVSWVEYRFPGSDVVVHRSAHLALKRWPDGMGAIAQAFNE